MSNDHLIPNTPPSSQPDYTAVLERIAIALEATQKYTAIIADMIGRYVKNQGC